MSKTNCWEFMKCNREPGGSKVSELGECQAAKHTGVASGLNNGTSAGRACWAIAGTFCGGKVQGDFAQKQANCVVCNFYKFVRKEEAGNFRMLPAKA